MNIVIKLPDGKQVIVELADDNTEYSADMIQKQVGAHPDLALAKNQLFTLKMDGTDINLVDFSEWGKKSSDQVQAKELSLALIPRQCGLAPDKVLEVKNGFEFLSPVVLGVLACIGLSVVAGLVSMTPLALGFTITAAVLACLGGLVGMVSVNIAQTDPRKADLGNSISFFSATGTASTGAVESTTTVTNTNE